MLFLAGALVPVAGVFLAWWLFLRRPGITTAFMSRPAAASIHKVWFIGWGFDVLYDALFVRPFVWAARINRGDFVDLLYDGAARFSSSLAGSLAGTQSGMIRRYALGIALGAILAVGLVLVL
jgi:NADH-quinone oxidoreductase subunit L